MSTRPEPELSPRKRKLGAAVIMVCGALFILLGLLPIILRALRIEDGQANFGFIAVGCAQIALGATYFAAAQKALTAQIDAENGGPK